jgi:hypothetical protein
VMPFGEDIKRRGRVVERGGAALSNDVGSGSRPVTRVAVEPRGTNTAIDTVITLDKNKIVEILCRSKVKYEAESIGLPNEAQSHGSVRTGHFSNNENSRIFKF